MFKKRRNQNFSNGYSNRPHNTPYRRKRNWWPLIRLILAFLLIIGIIVTIIVLIVSNSKRPTPPTPTQTETSGTATSDPTTPTDIIPELLVGTNTTLYRTSYTAHTVRFNCSPNLIKSISIDGEKISSENYTINENEQSVLFLNSFIQSLSKANHVLSFEFKNETLQTTLAITDLLPLPETINRGLYSDVTKVYDKKYEESKDEADKAINNNSWFFAKLNEVRDNGQPVFAWDRTNDVLSTFNKYNGIYYKDTKTKNVYLTFDCGYENGYTTYILDILKEKNIKAIFFVTGSYINDLNNRNILLRMIDEGHIIGNHTYTHPNMSALSDEDFIEELNQTQLALNDVLGFEYKLTFYRPPEGSTCERDLYIANSMGYSTVLWSYAYNDYNPENQPDIIEALDKAKATLYNGCVYLLHAVSKTNTEILSDLIDYMNAKGYSINRIDQ